MNPILHLVPLVFVVLASPAAELNIDNRAPKPGEVGYRPADNAVVRLNPPSWIWLHEDSAVSYGVQWSQEEDFAQATMVEDLPFNTYTHYRPLAPGLWFWRYRFADSDGQTSSWSRSRRLTIPTDAVEFPMPTRPQQRERVPAGHPRLFFRPQDLPGLQQQASGPLSSRFKELEDAARALMKEEPTPEPEHMGSARDKNNAELVRYWWPNRVQTMKACEEAELLAFVYLITQDPELGKAARRWILHLASWDPDGPTNFRMNCEAAKPLLYRLPRAYDWAYAALTAEDREAVRKMMLRRATDAWESWEVQRGVGHFNSPFGSHANRTWHKLGECAIAFLGELPEAETWLDYAVNKFHACYPVWADDDGGWHEGVSYWGGYMGKSVWWLQVAQSALGIDGLKKPFFAQIGDFPMYVAPPHSPNAGFGDLAYRPPSTSWGGFMEFFIRAGGASEQSHAPYWRWWIESWNMRGQSGILGFLYAANLPGAPEPKPPTDLPASKVFHGIGVASLHNTLLDSREDVHLLFKASSFGRQSHGHNPHNSFLLNAYGQELLTTCVYRDLHGSQFHYKWAHSTRAHNAVLVNEQGQVPHSPAPLGKIIHHQLTPALDHVVGDATAAYPTALTRYHRHVAFLKPDLVVVYDDLVSKEPATFQFLLHGGSAFELDEQANRLSLAGPQAGVSALYLPPLPLRFRQWDGYEPPPSREFPNQWHVEASTLERRSDCGMITVIVPYRAGQEKKWNAERLESTDAIGIRFTRDGQPVHVAFRKHGAVGDATIAGHTFTERIASW